MSMLVKLAVAGAAATSAIALYDAVHHGLTGRYSVFSEDSELPAVAFAGSLVHGFTYAVLAAVLIRLAQSGVRRFSRTVAGLLAVDFGVLAVLFLIVEPIMFATDADRAATPAVLSAAGGAAFLLMFVLSFVLGLSLLRQSRLRPVVMMLLAIVPVLVLTILAEALGSGFAHPAYAEILVNFGVALLARPAVAGSRDRSRSMLQTASPAS
jgi:hypothetical protein